MSDFKAKMHQIRFWLGLCPRPRWGSLQRSPDPLAGFNGPTSKEREGRGGEGPTYKGKVKGGRGRRGRKRMEGEGNGNGGPTFKGREVKGVEGEKGEGGSPQLLRFPPRI